jgi:hypothetical protein
MTGTRTALTWLYARGRQSVRIEARETEGAFEVVISGPGPRRVVVACPDRLAMITTQMARERDLVEQGFSLQPVVERRKTRR